MKRSRNTEEETNSTLADEQEVTDVPVSKIVGLDVERSNHGSHTTTTLQCSMPGHLPGLKFATYNEYESHYNSTHTNRCLECGRNFPSSHYLDLHIAECHDALIEIRRERGEAVYACFVETCAEKFKTFKKREDHLVKSHMFPSNYFFAVTKYGIDERRSLLCNSKGGTHRNKARPSKTISTDETEKPTVAEQSASRTKSSKDTVMTESRDPTVSQVAAVDTDMEDLTEALSSMKFVPRTVRFGPRQRAGFARR